MKYRYLTYTFVIFIVSFFLGCEKEISVNLPIPENKLVVEGWIEEGQPAIVIISKNTPYFGTVDSSTIVEMFVQDALVMVSEGTIIDTLQFSINPFQFPFIQYVGHKLIGESGKNYNLTIEYHDKTYRSITSIPPSVPIDSLVYKPEFEGDTLGYIWLYFTDPDTLGNNYRLFTKTLTLDVAFVHPFSSVLDDKLVNGKRIDYPLYRGLTEVERANLAENGADNSEYRASYMFKPGQEVVIKLCSIDATHFRFWTTIEQQMATNGNPFASPTTPQTNIDGGALGIWGGYGISLDTLLIEK